MSKWIYTTITSIVFIVLILISGLDQNPSELKNIKLGVKTHDIMTSSKPVVMILVDSLMDESLQKVIQNGEAPVLKFLIDKGKYFSKVVSSYPTMSVTIDSTLLTGGYAHQHHVPGLVWFHHEENRVVSYGSGFKEIWKQGIQHIILDSLKDLNAKHLNPDTKTIFEDLSNKGIDSASINGLIFRGDTKQIIHLPDTFARYSDLPEKINVNAPSVFSLGSLSQMNPSNQTHHVWQKFGVNDPFSVNELLFLLENHQLPPFSLVYFPNNDQVVHKKGPEETEGIIEVDKQLQRIVNAFPTWEDAINEVSWVILGDSGQSTIINDKEKSLIKLKTLLNDYHIYELGTKVMEQDQIVLCVNERMTYVYVLDDNVSLQEMAEKMKQEHRIDFIAWKEDESVKVISPDHTEILTFQPNSKHKDIYDQSWLVDGNLEVLDLKYENNQIQYKTYPDALARLYGALNSHQGRFLVTDAKIGYEFTDDYSPTHLGGGGHGSLHEKDSYVPMIVTGTHSYPKHARMIDIKDWLLQLITGRGNSPSLENP
ncbi:alkaline phosphatase family protein [Chengkuizengella axinellae]|uniref:Alkaline phosphatase family protein n=1 Tax=Chengkuizengella axinellae TaxID=3064388 RepID=A0ABT9IUH4_9BACL|nr:alkaline phosphatase family protein [Chengkuizengella sp. 2205SS18-9]MDP5273009.1 alkaline phosphatase family protein [Chengkuizengella sp. 2205SS18-9]